MTEPKSPLLKDLLGPDAVATIADAGVAASARFDRAAFATAALAGLDTLSIMERVRHIADALHPALPADYPTALDLLRAMAPHLTHAFQVMAITEYVPRHGLSDVDRSLAALADLTRFGSAEFAVRPFLAQDVEGTLRAMQRWSRHENEHVRRLASEGSRPRLPWGSRIAAFRQDPTLAAPILDTLRADPSAYVRKSVANHLNDIGKDRPDWLVAHLSRWPGEDAATSWIVRHALRTLVKQGDPAALALLGADHDAQLAVEHFAVAPAAVALGEAITLDVRLRSTAPVDQHVVVDYRLHYVRPRGKSAAKVFKLKTFDLPASATVALTTRQTIRDFSTRRHHPGRHVVELFVNGHIRAIAAFDLAGG
ncbi:DNA alkylation repair protein [Sphingomonas sp. Leaf10]|uniref:DNA alkylation repair protein n=1 Tax=Sphingomonas sp. Leaf10 TaxID=1735676 RepID=UPI0006F603B1|nr:DNA alkylation repair protein [Sphingomonas sp. Leaf10]KQM32163.1 DNA alkylation repair protein [Sphingomonas sp. Leaf10]